MKSNIKWILFFAAVLLICMGTWHFRLHFVSSDTKTAVITQNGRVIRTIDLAAVTEPYEFDVTDSHGGRNRIRAEHGRIAVISADCPDLICVNHGYIEDGAGAIVCLPHRLSIVIEDSDGSLPDAVAGGN